MIIFPLDALTTPSWFLMVDVCDPCELKARVIDWDSITDLIHINDDSVVYCAHNWEYVCVAPTS